MTSYWRAVVDIWDDIVFWLAIGMVLAALVETLVPPLALAQWGSGLAAMGMMLLVGIPIYICATASTPVAAGLLLAGISPGTVLVFLLAGPANNIATMIVVARELGRTTALIYLTGIAHCSVALGLGLDALVAWQKVDVVAQLADEGELIPHWLAMSSLLLLMLGIKPIRRLLL
ncbi:permease [Candidatus Reidiella endopervernicosa]|uniref:Permease n=1 Tax=Candidatus Reidiella endopervernicosa TaxID=2738883 RepID=A0A6N0HSN0_9GAMM|nr:permease [Candidatus Reidiella endopervernicosa]QKQ25271.1 permease [Candidatus Reidiella endopervernicosa]